MNPQTLRDFIESQQKNAERARLHNLCSPKLANALLYLDRKEPDIDRAMRMIREAMSELAKVIE